MAQDYTGLLMVAGIAGLGWYAYEQGWLSGLLPNTTPNASPPPNTGSSAPPSGAGTGDPLANCLTLTLPTGDPATVANQLAQAMALAQASSSPNKAACIAKLSALITQNQINQANIYLASPLPAPTPAPQSYSSTYAALQSAAGTTMLTPDQWSYYWGRLPGNNALSASDFDSLLTNMAITDRNQQIPLATFITGLKSLHEFGISGLGYYGVPVGAIHGGW